MSRISLVLCYNLSSFCCFFSNGLKLICHLFSLPGRQPSRTSRISTSKSACYLESSAAGFVAVECSGMKPFEVQLCLSLLSNVGGRKVNGKTEQIPRARATRTCLRIKSIISPRLQQAAVRHQRQPGQRRGGGVALRVSLCLVKKKLFCDLLLLDGSTTAAMHTGPWLVFCCTFSRAVTTSRNGSP